MAWFIGQSAVMIVLAFLLGLFVGWLIWGRRVRTLLIEVRDLRTRVEECEANHGAAKLPAAAERPVAVEEHEEPVREDDESVAVPAVVNSAGSVGTNGATAVVEAPPATANGASTPSKRVSKKAKAQAEPVDESVVAAPVHIPAPRAEMAAAAADEDVAGSAGSVGVAGSDASDGSDSSDDDVVSSAGSVGVADEVDAAGSGRAHAGAVAGDDVAGDDVAVETASVGAAGGDDDVTGSAGSVGLAGSDASDASDGPDGGGGEDVVNSAGSVGVVHADALAADADPADAGPIDDLARIEGIGPKIAAALVAAGIRTYAQLADSDEVALTKAINTGGIRFAPSMPSWAQQARLLADGDEAAFKALTDRLIAGREVAAAAAADVPPDDFARIEGIGPKIAGALVASGIRTFAQLAASGEDTLTTAINAAGIHFAPSLVTWAEQAQLLADGDEERFAELTARLIAGRRPDDDLERIEGIGPKMAAALHAAGIRTYRGLADSDDGKLRAAITAAGLSFAPSVVTWSRQARLLADGDEDGFADLTRRLVAGRDEGRA